MYTYNNIIFFNNACTRNVLDAQPSRPMTTRQRHPPTRCKLFIISVATGAATVADDDVHCDDCVTFKSPAAENNYLCGINSRLYMMHIVGHFRF